MEKFYQPNEISFVCIPKKLELEGRPELAVLPLNIAFIGLARIINKLQFATALYEPDLDSYQETSISQELKYLNSLEATDWVEITYVKDKQTYQGRKIIKDEFAFNMFGQDWQDFFKNLTSTGVLPGESCEIKNLE